MKEITEKGIKYFVPEDQDDSKAKPPFIKFDEEKQMWDLTFESGDSGGYDVEEFHYYFNSKADLLEYLNRMQKEKNENRN